MTTWGFIICFAVSFIAAALHFVQEMNDNRKTAKKGNFIWTEKQYFLDQKWSVVASLLTNILCLFLLPEAIAKFSQIGDWKFAGFSFIGYGGDALATKAFGFAKNRLDAAIDDKTTKADLLNPNPQEPTPMVMPKDKI